MRRFAEVAAFCGLLIFSCASAGWAEEKTDARARAAFTSAWQSVHDTKSDPDALATKLYREAWLGQGLWDNKFSFVKQLPPYPDDASAESILRGEHGDCSTWRLWDMTEDLCLDFFTRRPDAIIKALAEDCRGEPKARVKAFQVIDEWHRSFYKNSVMQPDGTFVLKNPGRKIWEKTVEELYPVVSKRFQEMEAPGEHEPLTCILRDLNDPRAIPLLMGKDGRSLKYGEILRDLQQKRKADPNLTNLLTETDPEVRWRATYALSSCGDPELTATAIILLRDTSSKVRCEALQLGFFIPAPRKPELDAQLKALLGDPDQSVRMECIRLFVGQRDMVCAPALLDILRNGRFDDHLSANLMVEAMRNLSFQDFGCNLGPGANKWDPDSPDNRAGLHKFESWIKDGHPIPALDQLIETLHGDLKDLRATVPWLKEYKEDCLNSKKYNSQEKAIWYCLPEKPDAAGVRQPDQRLIVWWLPLSHDYGRDKDGTKWDAFHDLPECAFPELNVRLAGDIIIHGEGNEEARKAIIADVVKRCAEWHKKLAK